MEASLPLSAATERAPRKPALASASLKVPASSISLPLRFMITGILALALGVAWLVLQPSVLATYHYNQHVIALTHLFVLGWICTIVMGAMYQLVPVALETKLYSERLAKFQFLVHVVGFVGMVWMFRKWNMTDVGHYGSALGFGVALFVYNIVRTLLRVPRWNVIATAVASAVGWIGLTILAGLMLACAKVTFDPDADPTMASNIVNAIASVVRRFDPISAMHAHAHLGAVGFFVMLIVGVSYKLIPMFTLSEIQSPRRAMTSVILLNVGLIGSFVCILTRSSLKVGFAALITVALAVYGWEMIAILRARKRGPLDWGIRYFLTAITLLLPLSLVGIALAWPTLPVNAATGQLENVYGFLGLIGVVSFAIIGMLYKILPFLVWFGAYSKHIGLSKVPALADLYSATLQVIGYWSFISGLVVTIAATLFANELGIRLGGGLIALSVGTLLVNVLRIVSHLIQPQLLPLTRGVPAKKTL